MEKHKQSNKIPFMLTSLLAKRFAFYTVSLSIIVALVISMAFIYYNYYSAISDLKKELTQAENSFKSSLSLHLWQMNMDALKIIANSLLTDKDIVYIKLLDEKGNTLIEKGKKSTKNIIKRSIPIYYKAKTGAKNIYLGKLVYIATTKEVYEKIEQIAITTVIAIFIFFLIFSLIILYIYWNSTVKYLLVIKEYANKIRMGGYKKEIGDLILERSNDNKHKKSDELDELVDTINEMHHEVIEKYKAIEYQSLHDLLTGLPNRRMLYNLIKERIKQCETANGYGILLDIDLDHFKLLNESMGHTTGDKILCEVATRLKATCKHQFQPVRISGDEFLVLCNDIISSKKRARDIAQSFSRELISAISQVITIDDNHFKITACIGISIFNVQTDHDTIVKQADNALHHAKSKGPGHISVFKPSMQQYIDRRLQLEQLLDNVVEKDLLDIYYQPKYNSQKEICSAEALVRLRDDKGSIISPAEFIPILEETGAIIKVGDYIIKKVFEFIHKYKNDFKKSELQSIAINVSPTQYSSKGFADRVIGLAKKFDIDPRSIILEITEEVVAGNIDDVIDVMKQLTEYGFKFSIDDFGTGYSSLRYLKNLPLGELKIDKSFIDGITTDNRANALVKTVIDMARNFKLDIVAEGVESESQFNILTQYNCELYQGYLFSKPLPEDDFLSKIHSNKS